MAHPPQHHSPQHHAVQPQQPRAATMQPRMQPQPRTAAVPHMPVQQPRAATMSPRMQPQLRTAAVPHMPVQQPRAVMMQPRMQPQPRSAAVPHMPVQQSYAATVPQRMQPQPRSAAVSHMPVQQSYAATMSPRMQPLPSTTPPQTTQHHESSFHHAARVVADPFAHLMSGAVAMPVSGLAGAAALAINKIIGRKVYGDPGEVTRHVQQQLTYQPRTREGQRIVDVIETPGRIVNQAADAAGNAITNAGIRSGHPKAGATIGTVAKTAIAAGVGYFLPKGTAVTARSVRSMERPTAPPPPSLRVAGSVQNRTALVQNPHARTPLVQNPSHHLASGTVSPRTVSIGQQRQRISPHITHRDLTNRTEKEATSFAKAIGLTQHKTYPPNWMDPVTGDARIRIDPAHVVKGTKKLYKGSASVPHLHGYTVEGDKIRNPDTGDSHFPLRSDD